MHVQPACPRQAVDVSLSASPARVAYQHQPGSHLSFLQVQAVASYQDRFIYVLAATFERARSTMEVWRLDLTTRLWEVVDMHGGQQSGHAVVRTCSWMPEEVAGCRMMPSACWRGR